MVRNFRIRKISIFRFIVISRFRLFFFFSVFDMPVNVVFQERVLEDICYDVLNLFVPIRAFPLGSCSKPQVSSDETTQTPNLYTMYILLLYVCKPCILTTKDFLLMNKIMV